MKIIIKADRFTIRFTEKTKLSQKASLYVIAQMLLKKTLTFVNFSQEDTVLGRFPFNVLSNEKN